MNRLTEMTESCELEWELLQGLYKTIRTSTDAETPSLEQIESLFRTLCDQEATLLNQRRQPPPQVGEPWERQYFKVLLKVQAGTASQTELNKAQAIEQQRGFVRWGTVHQRFILHAKNSLQQEFRAKGQAVRDRIGEFFFIVHFRNKLASTSQNVVLLTYCGA